VNVINANPTAAFTAPTSIVEGSSIPLALNGSADASSVDAASLTYSFDCGDGAGFQPASSTASVSCATTDDGTRTVRGRVIDKDGGATMYSASVMVTNAAPIITSFSAPAGPTSTGTPITATVSFTDVGTADTHTATITWGDGTTSTVDAGSALQASASHVYTWAGFYTIGVTVLDDDGGSATSGSAIVIYNPAAGSISGGGFIDAGSGRKTFVNIDVRYGSTIPTGRFAIHGSPLILDLASSSFEYLVVSGSSATFRGAGTLSDGTSVGFLVSALDGKSAGTKVDLIRLKVWNVATGQVIYDTDPGVAETAAPTTVLAGGNVTLHQ
jgi:hypothetical protein